MERNGPVSYLPIAVIGGLFFLFGFITWLNGFLIPFLQIVCELDNIEAYFVTLSFYISYTIMALPMSAVVRRNGYKTSLIVGLLIMVGGALAFVPAALTRNYALFLAALFALGAGLTLLQAASNPYLVTIGPRKSAAVRISMMGVLNKSAGALAPIVFTAFLLTDISKYSDVGLSQLSAMDKDAILTELSSRLVRPYLFMAGALAMLAIFVRMSPLPEPDVDEVSVGTKNGLRSVLRHPNVVLGAMTLFFYVGAEVIAGDTIGLFGRDLGVTNFGQLTAYTLCFMVLGYLLGMLVIPQLISQERALAICATFGIVCTLLVVSTDPNSGTVWNLLFAWTGAPAIPDVVLYVALFGLANSLVWPAVWPLALSGLTEAQISAASALLIMGIAGGAVLPIVYGGLAEIFGSTQSAYWLMIPCYVFILTYALQGHLLRSWFWRVENNSP